MKKLIGVIALSLASLLAHADGISGTVQTNKIKGTTTNNSANAGFIGEYVESVVQNVSAGTTSTWTDTTSISLTPGDWDVDIGYYVYANGATVTLNIFGVSSTSGTTFPSNQIGSNQSYCSPDSISGTSQCTGSVVRYRISVASTTTYYLKTLSVYTVATPKIYARISARRVR